MAAKKTSEKKPEKKKTINFKKYFKPALRVVVGFLLFSGLLLFVLNNFINYFEKVKKDPTLYSNSEYDIIFLNNNLFYFCKLEEYNAEYIKCNDPYYLVKRKEDQPDGTKADKVYVTTPAAEEIYEPQGSIYLRKENIVYIAKIGDESAVKQYIDQQSK